MRSRWAGLIKRGLEEEHVAVDLVLTGEEAVWMATENEYDAIVLDVVLGDIDGFEVCRRLRRAGRWAPVLMLTARDAVEDRVRGLDVGADDYLTKPFDFTELLARLRALFRRGREPRPSVLSVGDLVLDPARHTVHRGGARDLSDCEGVRAARVLHASRGSGSQPNGARRARLGLCVRR